MTNMRLVTTCFAAIAPDATILVETTSATPRQAGVKYLQSIGGYGPAVLEAMTNDQVDRELHKKAVIVYDMELVAVRKKKILPNPENNHQNVRF